MEKGLSFKSISIELTKRCNLECTYCYARSNKSEVYITREQIGVHG